MAYNSSTSSCVVSPMMAHNSSTSSSSSTSESSLSSSPCSCSSPSSLPQPPLPRYVSKLSVPFLWEEKPGITKPAPSSSSLKPCTNLFYGTSLELPPLPPPPCLSQAFPFPRSRASKLIEAKPSKEEQLEDPFFLALKACTKVDNICSRDVSKATFDGVQVALKPTSKGQRSMESKRGGCKKAYEDSDHHQTRRGVSFNHHQTRREISFNGEGNGRGKLVAPSTHGTLHDLLSIEEKASRVVTRRPNLHTVMLEKDEESTNSRGKGAHHHMNASSKGLLIQVGGANVAKKEDPLQGVHAKAYPLQGRKEYLVGAKEGGHIKLREVIAHGHRKPKHNNAKACNALDRINEGHSKAKHSAKVVEFIYCRGY